MGSQFPAAQFNSVDAWHQQFTSPLNALRIVLTIALDRNVAIACLGEDTETSLSLWPSSLYGLLATEAVRSASVWERCSRHIDQSLGETGRRFEALPASSLTWLLRDGALTLSHRELASLLWALLKRREPMSEFDAGRRGAEFEIVSVRRRFESTERTSLHEVGMDLDNVPNDLATYLTRDDGANVRLDQTIVAHRH